MFWFVIRIMFAGARFISRKIVQLFVSLGIGLYSLALVAYMLSFSHMNERLHGDTADFFDVGV